VVDSLGNTKASIAPATAVTSTRIRTSMSLVEDGTYRLSVVGNGVYTLQCARILISQKYATKTATFFPLLSSIATITAGNPVMTLAPGTTYPVFPTNTNLWDYRPTNYKGLDTQEPVVLETVFQSSAGTATLGFVGQTSNFVASETVGNASLTLRQSTISDLSPLSVETSGFGVRSRADTPAADVRFHRAGIWVKYSNFSKGEIYIRLHTRTGTMAATTFAGNRYLFEPSAWNGTPKFYYEHTGHTAGSNNYYLRYDELDSGSDGASAVGTQIADSVRSVNSSTWMSRRSAPITSLPENGRIFVEHEGGNGHTAWSHFLIVRYQ
jgi:hypothetical protein